MDRELWRNFCARPAEETFEPLYAATRALVYTLCLRILRDPEAARDAFQAVYCRLLEVARRRGEKAEAVEVENIVYRLAVREADNLRHRRRRRAAMELPMDSLEVEVAGSGDPPPSIAVRREMRARVEELVATLPERYRLPVELHYFHGRSYAEIGRILGQPVGTVSVHLARALRKLDPLFSRAGLGRAVTVLVAIGAAGSLIAPPTALSASVVFAAAGAAAASGSVGAASAAAPSASILALGIVVMKTKAGIISLCVLLGLLGLSGLVVLRARSAAEPEVRIASTGARQGESGRVRVEEGQVGATGGAERAPVLPPGPVILGVVSDEETGEPVAGASVRHGKDSLPGDAILATDAAGRFEVRGLAAGRYQLWAWSDRHVRETCFVVVPESGETRVGMRLEQGFAVDVLVTDTEGGPIAGASIYGQPEVTSKNGASTDAEGRAVVLGVSRRNPHDIYAAKEGYGFAGAFQPVFEPDGERGSVTIALEREDRIHVVFAGRVADEDGLPVAGARVLWSQTGAESADSTTTGANGEYRLEAHSRSEHNQLSVLREGYAPAWEANPPRGTPESPGIVDFTLTAGHWIEGAVMDESGMPLAGALVVVYSKNEKGQIFETPLAPRPTTDARGRFRFERLPGPEVRLQVRGPGATFTEYGGWSLFEEWFAVDRAVTITLRREGVLSLRVADGETGEPVASFRVRHDGGYHDDWAVGHAVEKEDGRFVLGNLAQGKTYEVKVEAEGYLSARKAGLTAKTREAAEEVVFALGRGVTLAGVVFDADTGAPVSGATVLCGSSADDRPGISWDPSALSRLDNAEQVETRRDGSFAVIEGDRPATLLIRAPGYERAAILPAERGRFVQSGVLRVGLRGGASVVGTYYLRREAQASAEVYLRRIDGTTQNLERVTTDAAGRYEWSGLAPGAYKLGAVTASSSRRRVVLEREFELGPRERKTVDLGGDLGPFSLSGEVSERGRPVHGALVKVEARFAWHYRHLETLTDPDGRFEIHGLPAGEYEILVLRWEPETKWMKKVLQVSGDSRQDFAFPDAHRITGRVLFPAGSGEAAGKLTRIHLRALGRAKAAEDPDQISESGSATLANGEFAITGRFRGEYRLALGHEAEGVQVSVGFSTVFSLDNTSGDQHLDDLAAPPLGALRILIELDPPESPWPQSIAISLREGNEERWLNGIYLAGRESARLVEPVKAGDFVLVALAHAFLVDPPRMAIAIAPGRTPTVTLRLRATGVIHGAVADAANPAMEPILQRVTLRQAGHDGEPRVITLGPGGADALDLVDSPRDWVQGNRYGLTNLAAGEYEVTVEAAGYEPHRYTQVVTPGLFTPAPAVKLRPVPAAR